MKKTFTVRKETFTTEKESFTAWKETFTKRKVSFTVAKEHFTADLFTGQGEEAYRMNILIVCCSNSLEDLG